MVGKMLLAVLLALPSCAFGQDASDATEIAATYTGELSQLAYKKDFSVRSDNSQMLFIQLNQQFYKEQKLTRDLKKLWRTSVSEHCNGKYKGRPKLSILVSSCLGYYSETAKRWICTDVVTGVHGAYLCSAGS